MTVPGNLYIIAAPSGAGKTSLVNALIARDHKVSVSVSHTTRAIRSGETNGKNYHFIDKETFTTMIKEKAFIEYAEVFGNYYGTAQQSIEEKIHKGQDVILEIDWQGARQIKSLYQEAIGIFILPPSKETLLMRLKGRGQDSQEIIEKRMQQAVSEMSHYDEFEYIIINKDFEIALEELMAIFKTNRLKNKQQIMRHATLIEQLLI